MESDWIDGAMLVLTKKFYQLDSASKPKTEIKTMRNTDLDSATFVHVVCNKSS